jgi:hypothetical protein
LLGVREHQNSDQEINHYFVDILALVMLSMAGTVLRQVTTVKLPTGITARTTRVVSTSSQRQASDSRHMALTTIA